VVTAFFEGVRRQGFVEGQNLTFIITHSRRTLICCPIGPPSWSKPASMSSQLSGTWQPAAHIATKLRPWSIGLAKCPKGR
jgi:hypothetical protein